MVVPLAVATVVFRRRAARLYDLSRDRIAIVNADFQESLSGVRESQAFVHEAATDRALPPARRATTSSRASPPSGWSRPTSRSCSSSPRVADAIVLGVGAGLIASGDLTTGALIAFILYIDMFFSPIQQLSQVFDSWQQTRVSVGRIAELMALETLTPQPPSRVDPGRLRGAVALDDVRFSYPSDRRRPRRRVRGPADARLPRPTTRPPKPPEALRGIDLQIAAGETVALVGETGAGKSTVMKLLARFYDPDAGAVAVDGHDLRDARPARRSAASSATCRRRRSCSPARSATTSPTAGRRRPTPRSRRRPARSAPTTSSPRCPAATCTELAERGRSLSAGQRQLIALARAELVDPAILLLDEATSNLDLATEARVAAAMQRVARERTTIVIAHRLQTARTADRIVVLDAGRIAETGTHDELLAAGGRYAAMWEAFELLGGGQPTRA